jgi:hypothetical protein
LETAIMRNFIPAMAAAALLGTAAMAQTTNGTAPAGKSMTATQHANEGHKHANLARNPGSDKATHYRRAAEHYRMAAEVTGKERPAPR